MAIHALTYLTLTAGAVPVALARWPAGLNAAGLQGRLLGCLVAEIGALNRVLLIHGYDDRAAADDDQARIAGSADVFGVADLITGISSDLFAPFPGTEPIGPGANGPIYEVRSYVLRAGGLPDTLAAWAKVLDQRVRHSPLLGALHALTGVLPRIVHIWPYPDLGSRARIRAATVEAGVWPPPGGLPHIRTMQSEVFLPAPFSPIR